ncbi:hypothetical protein GCM10023084_03150 [Streptomyces lacrimifluminis]|uniref:hypothetical protein n=1 Tax=Streptomyces lacrimifluminis TaxID=1500077 RepID=UPI0031EFDB99
MSYPIISRRSLPDSLRWFADKLESPSLTDAERSGIAVSLLLISEEISPAATEAGGAIEEPTS